MTGFKFDVGDRVKRPIDIWAPLDEWRYKFGMIIRRYAKEGYPELYDVWWDGREQFDKGYLPHGLEPAGYERKEDT